MPLLPNLAWDGHTLRRARWRLLQAMAPPRRTVESRGLRFTLPADNWMTHYRWQTYNTKEPETLDWIDQRLQNGEVLFDIGANIGLYSIYAALRHPAARVVALEPEYSNLHLLRDNIIANQLQERITVYSIALSSHSGISQLHLQDLTPGSAMHTESPEALPLTRSQQPIVWRAGIYALTLDQFCRETSLQPHALKLDVDGTELDILEGGAQTLRSRALRSVLVEMPEDADLRRRCETCLQAAELQRAWRHPSGGSPNEIWVRHG